MVYKSLFKTQLKHTNYFTGFGYKMNGHKYLVCVKSATLIKLNAKMTNGK